jgi:hypothetical protein
LFFKCESPDYRNDRIENQVLDVVADLLQSNSGSLTPDTFTSVFFNLRSTTLGKRTNKPRILGDGTLKVDVPVRWSKTERLSPQDTSVLLNILEDTIAGLEAFDAFADEGFILNELKLVCRRAAEEAPNTQQEIDSYLVNVALRSKRSYLAKIDEDLAIRRSNARPLTKRLAGVRLYDSFGTKTLLPHRYICAELFDTLLRNAKIMTPSYSEIYFHIAATLADAKRDALGAPWSTSAYCALDIALYQNTTESKKEQLIRECLYDGLRTLAEVDHLDKERIESAIAEIDSTRSDANLSYVVKEGRTLFVEVLYRISPDPKEKATFRLRVTEKDSGRSGECFIDKLSALWAPYSFGKISIGKETITIEARESERAKIALEAESAPKRYVFSIQEILSSRAS